MKRLLLTGATGFTGRYVHAAALQAEFDIHCLSSNILNTESVLQEIKAYAPTHVLHLAAISSVMHQPIDDFYQVNVLGTYHVLRACEELEQTPERVLIASSANVYGAAATSIIDETCVPQPVNHYAASKLSCELMARCVRSLPIVIVRPFNYTGVGHSVDFVLPKLVAHFQQRAPEIALGSIQVAREFNDVRTVADIYVRLLQSAVPGQIYSICSGKPVMLSEAIHVLEQLTQHKPRLIQDPRFMRAQEIPSLCGDPRKLEALLGPIRWYSLQETLQWMLEHQTA